MRARLFVYGTLRSGGSQHARMAGAILEGAARTRPEVTLVDVGWHPALFVGGTTAVAGEVYSVDAALLEALDAFEGVPQWYQRLTLTLADGRAAMTYVMRPEDARGYPVIPGGDWLAHHSTK